MSAPTYLTTIHRHRLEYEQYVASNSSSLPVLSKVMFANFLLIACLMLPQRPSLLVRSVIFVLIVLLSLSSLQSDRTIGLTYGVLIGLSSIWCIVSAMNFLLLHDHTKEFQRLVSTSGGKAEAAHVKENNAQDRKQWESIPKPFFKRLCWILDLLSSLSTLHWSQGRPPSSTPTNPRRPGPPPPPPASLQKKLSKLLIMYLSINILKDLIALDPYFWGSLNSALPAPHPLSTLPARLITLYRLTVCFAVIYIGVEWPAITGSAICINILGPSVIGPWGHEWAHRAPIGSVACIAQRGLKGFWGGWWHQWFRWTVASPGVALVHTLSLAPTSTGAKTIRLTLPFLLSGLIHAAASYTLWGPSRPGDAFLFFAAQPLGIAVQGLVSGVLARVGLLARIPEPVRRAANTAFTAAWLLSTFPWLADDFVRGGMYLTEPVAPFSVLPLLGMGGVRF